MIPARFRLPATIVGVVTLVIGGVLATQVLSGDNPTTSDTPDQLAFSDDDGPEGEGSGGQARAAARASETASAPEQPPSVEPTGDQPTEHTTGDESSDAAAGVVAGEADDRSADHDGPDPALLLPTESLVATVVGDGVASSAEPGGPAGHFFPSPTQFGGDRTFLIVDDTSSPDWIKVSLPVKPNGQEGWIPRAAVEVSSVAHRAVIDLSDHSVTVWHGDEVVVQTGAVTGKPSTPTPLGTFYIRDIVAQPDDSGIFGPYVVALSGFSDVLDTFNGGLPALAIHGTDQPDQIGTERSSGCIRIPNDLITLVAETVPLGTPVAIVA